MTEKNEEPRELTEDEVYSLLMEHIWTMVDYWDRSNLDLSPEANTRRRRLSGLAFSILAMLDGSNIGLPAFIVAPRPHPDDKEFHRQEGENWFPQNHEASVNCDLGGILHEQFYRHDPRK